MTWQFLNALELFSPEKKKKKKVAKVVNLPLTDEKLYLSFWRHKQVKWLLQFSKLSLDSYVSL